MKPSERLATDIADSLPRAWGKPLLGVPFPCARAATRRMGVNWSGDESIDRLEREVGPRFVLGCSIFHGVDKTGKIPITRVDVWVRA